MFHYKNKTVGKNYFHLALIQNICSDILLFVYVDGKFHFSDVTKLLVWTVNNV